MRSWFVFSRFQLPLPFWRFELMVEQVDVDDTAQVRLVPSSLPSQLHLQDGIVFAFSVSIS